ncbi:MAG TPA: prephenate dehydrogenase [Anaerolineae bacterium]
MDTRLRDSTVTIVGLGLMGGSLALALRGHCAQIVGVEVDSATLAFASERAIIDRAVDFDAAHDCDVLVLATPVRTILSQLQRLSQSTTPQSAPLSGGQARAQAVRNQRSTIVLDLGSTKREIVAAMESLPPHFDPIGGHPLCGKETSGIQAADAGLFRGTMFVLSPLARTSARALALARELVEAVGARPLLIDAAQHDRCVAMTSHLPYLLASALVRAAERLNDERVWQLAASGFRDTSRLAASDVTMMADILHTNRADILDALSAARAEIDQLAALIESRDEAALRAALEPIRERRAQLFTARTLQPEFNDAFVDLWPGA